MAYGPPLTDTFQRGAYYVSSILKGAEPDDLPVEQPANFELVVNLRTANSLGLTLPPYLLAGASSEDGERGGCARMW